MFIGTESETKAFMAVCIETAKRYNLDDYRTPVFIFERLCSIIYPVSELDPCLFHYMLHCSKSQCSCELVFICNLCFILCV